MSDRLLVIQTEDLDRDAAAWLGERCDFAVQPADGSVRWRELLSRASALVVRTYTRVDRAMLELAPKLRVVGRAGVGLDNIDVAACRSRGVEVVHTPGANTRAVVEYVTALLLDALRPRLFIDRALESEEWNRLRRELVADRELGELTLGVWGLGRVGSGVARVGGALGMRVLANDLRTIAEDERARAGSPTMVDVATLLRESDVLTVHVDERASNRGLVDGRAFGAMRANVLFLNTSRGFIVDAPACAAFMRAHPEAMAILDVHEPEPFDATYPLLGIPNVLLAPHLASGTRAAKARMSWVVRDVWRVLNGEKPEFPAQRM